MKKTLNNKKGSFFDAFFIVGFIFVMGITILLGGQILNSINDVVDGNNLFEQKSQDVITKQSEKYRSVWDSVFLFIFVGLFIASIISSLFIDTHPAFFFVTIIAMTILVFLTAILSNIYEQFAINPSLIDTSQTYVFIPFIFSKLVELTIGLGLLILLALYAKTRT